MPGSSARVTRERLQTIRTLWRQPDTMTLWGLPYRMRPGGSQTPYHLFKAERDWKRPRFDDRIGPRQIDLSDWIYLGEPGWWGSRTREEQGHISKFLDEVRECVPDSPAEFSPIPCSEGLGRLRRGGRR